MSKHTARILHWCVLGRSFSYAPLNYGKTTMSHEGSCWGLGWWHSLSHHSKMKINDFKPERQAKTEGLSRRNEVRDISSWLSRALNPCSLNVGHTANPQGITMTRSKERWPDALRKKKTTKHVPKFLLVKVWAVQTAPLPLHMRLKLELHWKQNNYILWPTRFSKHLAKKMQPCDLNLHVFIVNIVAICYVCSVWLFQGETCATLSWDSNSQADTRCAELPTALD